MIEMLYVLVLVVCANDTCRDVQVPGEGGMIACVVAAPPVAAQYAVEHPGVIIGGYRCQPAGRDT